MPQRYTTVGHVTVDVLPDGSRVPGGAAFYSALQAARLGARARLITRGDTTEVRRLLAPFAGELEVEIEPAPCTTTLLTSGVGASREQRVLAWAGPIERARPVSADVLHLAPVARELAGRWTGAAGFVGLTPQGLLRSWETDGRAIELVAPADAGGELATLARACSAVVVSEHERAPAAGLLEHSRRAGAVVAVTAAERPNELLLPDGAALALAVPPVASPAEDLGAGDVFAAAFFVALAEGEEPLRAAALGNAAAALRMSARGTAGISDRAAVERRAAYAR